MTRLTIVKIGGNVIDQAEGLEKFLELFSSLEGNKILVHGGGKLATEMAGKLNIPQQMLEGRRITDAATLKLVSMVYAGDISKRITAHLQALHVNAIGLSGCDGNIIQARKRTAGSIDYGFAGDLEMINTAFLELLLNLDMVPVINPITHDGKGQLLNTNADTLARELAIALSSAWRVQLVFSFERSGVLLDEKDEKSLIPELDHNRYQQLKTAGKIHGGMIPKLDNAFAALQQGVNDIIIGSALELPALLAGSTGTKLVYGS